MMTFLFFIIITNIILYSKKVYQLYNVLIVQCIVTYKVQGSVVSSYDLIIDNVCDEFVAPKGKQGSFKCFFNTIQFG